MKVGIIMKKNCAIYCRVSTREQAEEGYSIDFQKHRCMQYATDILHYSNTYIKSYIDEGYSGKNTNRPSYERLIYDISTKKISALIIYDLDRMSRNTVDSLMFFEFLESKVCEIYIINGNYSNKTANEKFILRTIISTNHLTSDIISEKTITGYHGAFLRGYYPFPQAPYGYKKIDRKLVPIENELEIVKRLYKMYNIDLLSTTQIETILKNEGHSNMHSKTISRILGNSVYTGTLVYREVEYTTLNLTRIVNEKEYAFTLEKLKRAFRNQKYTYHYYKKLICNECGDVLQCSVTKKKKNEVVQVYQYYICKNENCLHYKKRINQDLVKLALNDILLKMYNRNKFTFYDRRTNQLNKQGYKKLSDIPQEQLQSFLVRKFPNYRVCLATKQIVKTKQNG